MHVAMKGNLKEVIHALPKLLSGVVAVTGVNAHAFRRTHTHPDSVLRDFADSAIAYLTVQNVLVRPESYSQVAFSVDFNRESKDKLLWASYMARFYGSTIRVMHRNYQDAAFKMRWRDNMRYLEKIFSGLGISYDSQPLEGGSEFGNPDLIAISHPDIDLFIALVADQRERDLGDLFASRPELKLLNNKQRKPVLFLNQRDDLYVMCD